VRAGLDRSVSWRVRELCGEGRGAVEPGWGKWKMMMMVEGDDRRGTRRVQRQRQERGSKPRHNDVIRGGEGERDRAALWAPRSLRAGDPRLETPHLIF
jgi:hypothetical protein